MAATTSISATNGAQSSIAPPFKSPISPNAKRKRSASSETLQQSQVSLLTSKPTKGVNPGVNFGNTIHDIWRLLERNDTSISILQHPIVTSASSIGTKVNGHSAKRHKTTEPSEPQTITAKVQDGDYATPMELLFDIETACSEINDQEKGQANGSQREYMASVPKTELLKNELNSFQALAKNLVQRSGPRREPLASPRVLANGESKTPEPAQDTIKKEDDDSGSKDVTLSRAVLTLFGNAQGHKQLFSSFQKAPPKAEKSQIDPQESHLVETLAKPVESLRESGLPNGISSTKIFSASSEEVVARAKPRTLLDVFPPPSALPPLVPPRTPKPSSSRRNTVTWTWPKPAAPKSALVHSQQRLAAGQWIGYDGVVPGLEPSSPENKRKQRDRTLSTGEVGAPSSAAVIAGQVQAQEEALFRSLYSSFAPSRDNSLAVYSEETKSQLWWQRTGQNQFYHMVGQSNSGEPDEEALEIDEHLEDEQEIEFQQAVEAFDPQLLELEKQAYPDEEKEKDKDKDGDSLLKEISELLEVVHSYQRIRNSCLNTSARSSIAQKVLVQDMMGTPSLPSSSELETYETLKAQLTLMVAMMPPHAVAKLNGDQLEELNIRSSIQLEQPMYRGVMEEDQAYRNAKLAAQTAATGPGPLTRGTSTSTPISAVPGQARTAPMTALSRSAVQPQQYGTGAPSLGRQTSGLSRQPLSAWQTPTQSYGRHAQQQGSYTGQQSFTQQQMSRPVQSTVRQSYTTASVAQVPTTPQANGLYGAGFAHQPAYQQRAQNYAATMANFNLQNAQQASATSNTRMYGSPQTDSNQYARPAGYPYTGQAQAALNTPGVAPMPSFRPRSQTPGGVAMSPVQPNVAAWQMKQSQSPAPASTAAIMPPNSVSAPSQPKAESQGGPEA